MSDRTMYRLVLYVGMAVLFTGFIAAMQLSMWVYFVIYGACILFFAVPEIHKADN